MSDKLIKKIMNLILNNIEILDDICYIMYLDGCMINDIEKKLKNYKITEIFDVLYFIKYVLTYNKELKKEKKKTPEVWNNDKRKWVKREVNYDKVKNKTDMICNENRKKYVTYNNKKFDI
jgi:hypothetical protein